MEIQREKWWQPKAHRKIPGSRGHRFMSLRGHLLFGSSIAGLFYWLLNVDREFALHAPPAPVPPPPPLPTSLSYTATKENPYLKGLELERSLPEHVPQGRKVDLSRLRAGQRLDTIEVNGSTSNDKGALRR